MQMKATSEFALLMSAVLALFTVHAGAAQTTGTVSEVTGQSALVKMNGDVLPPVGTKAEIYFKIAGVDEEISVATGTAGAIDHGALRVKIESATGNVEKGQLVRFSPSGTTSAAPAKSLSSQPNKPLAFKQAIVGEWKQRFEEPLLIFEKDGRVRANERGGDFGAKYRIDTSVNPPRLTLYDFDKAEAAPPGGEVRAIFEVEGDRLKFESSGESKDYPTAFTDDAMIGMRTGEPVGEKNAIVGAWRRTIPITNLYTFTQEGRVRTYYEVPGVKPDAKEYKYQLDDSTSPAHLNFYFDEVDGDPSFRGIIEFESNDRMRLDGQWTRKEEERPTTFGKDTYEFTRTR